MWKFQYFKPYLSPGSVVSFLFLLITLVSGTYIINDKNFTANIVNRAASTSCSICQKNAEDPSECADLCKPISKASPKPKDNDDKPAASSSNPVKTCGYCNESNKCVGCDSNDNNVKECSSDSNCQPAINSSSSTPNPGSSGSLSTTKTCDVNGVPYGDGSKVIGGASGGTSGYSKCVGGSWVDCPECTLTTLTTIPVYAEQEYLQQIQQQQQQAIQNLQNLQQLEATELEVSRISCDQSGGTWTGSQCINSVQTFITTERDEEGTTRTLTTIYRDQNDNAVASTTTPVTINTTQSFVNTGEDFKVNTTTKISDLNTGDLISYLTQTSGPAKKSDGVTCTADTDCNSGKCEYSQLLTTGKICSSSVNLTAEEKIYNLANTGTFGLFENYVSSFNPDNVTYNWQANGYDSVEECQQDAISSAQGSYSGAMAAAKCNTYQPTQEQVTSSTELGTVITAEIALLATGVGYGTGSLTGVAALNQAMAAGTIIQAGSAASTCIEDPNSSQCRNEAIWTAIGVINIGSAANLTNAIASGSQQAIRAAQQINTGVNAANLVGDIALDVVDNCFGENQNNFGCGLALGTTILDLGGGALDLVDVLKPLDAPSVIDNVAGDIVASQLSPSGSSLSTSQANIADDLSLAMGPNPNVPSNSIDEIASSISPNEVSILDQVTPVGSVNLTNSLDEVNLLTTSNLELNEIGVLVPSGTSLLPDGSLMSNNSTDELLNVLVSQSPDLSPSTQNLDLVESPSLNQTGNLAEENTSSFLRNLFDNETKSKLITNPDSLEILNDPAFQRLKERGLSLRQGNTSGDFTISDDIKDLQDLRNEYLDMVVDEMTVKQKEWGRLSREARRNDLPAPKLTYERLSEIIMSIPNESTSIDYTIIENVALRYDYSGDLSQIRQFVDSRGGTVGRREILDYVADYEVSQLAVNNVDGSINATEEFRILQDHNQTQDSWLADNVIEPIQNYLDDGTDFGSDALLTVGGGTYKGIQGQKLVINPKTDLSLQKYIINARSYLEQNRLNDGISRADLLNDFVSKSLRYADPAAIEYSGASQLREQIYSQGKPARLGQFIDGNTGVCREFAACMHVLLADSGKPNFMTVGEVSLESGINMNQQGGRHAWIEFIDTRTGQWMVADPTHDFVLPREQAYRERYVTVDEIQRDVFVWPEQTSWWDRLTKNVKAY